MPSILVIEDDAIIRETIGTLLEMEGYEVREASNGQEALHGLRQHSAAPCLILLDVMMPVMDGIAFRQRQLQDPAIAAVPVVVMSGRADLAEVQELQSLPILHKPFDVDRVLQIAGQHCRPAI